MKIGQKAVFQYTPFNVDDEQPLEKEGIILSISDKYVRILTPEGEFMARQRDTKPLFEEGKLVMAKRHWLSRKYIL